MAGKQMIILPTIKLSYAISPQIAKQISNPNDIQQFQWQSLATAALDPLDFSGSYTKKKKNIQVVKIFYNFSHASNVEMNENIFFLLFSKNKLKLNIYLVKNYYFYTKKYPCNKTEINKNKVYYRSFKRTKLWEH